MFFQYTKLLCVLEVTIIAGLQTSVPRQGPRQFSLSLSSVLDMMPSIQPLVAAGSNRCETLKSFLGLTYEQMHEKKSTDWTERLNIDLVTKNGNVKFNLTNNDRLKRVMQHANTVVILIHGFMESSDGLMVQGVAPELLKQRDLKILALDGRKIINLEYFRSSTYVRFIGERLGEFLSDMIKRGQDPSKLLLIGHSLGAHIAGVAGEIVRQNTGKLIGRITALDPAGPCFTSVTVDKRLDRTDAAYVDVVHTNAGILGLKEPVTKISIPTGARLSLAASCPHVTTQELGSCTPRLLHIPTTFQLGNALTGRCSETVAV